MGYYEDDKANAELFTPDGWMRTGDIARSHPAIFFECDENQATVHAFLSGREYVFFDFASMRRLDEIPHNCLALHSRKHAEIIEGISASRPAVH